jgi:hypothetical protein
MAKISASGGAGTIPLGTVPCFSVVNRPRKKKQGTVPKGQSPAKHAEKRQGTVP